MPPLTLTRACVALVFLTLTGCAHPGGLAGFGSQGRLLAEIRVTNTAFGGPPKGDTGLFFHVNDAPGSRSRSPQVTGYHYDQGKFVAMVQLGADSAALLKAWDALPLVAFDFNVEAAASEQRRQAKGGDIVIRLDGAEYRLVLITPRGRFAYRAGNALFYVNHYDPDSEKIAQVKAAVDLLAPYFGSLKFSW